MRSENITTRTLDRTAYSIAEVANSLGVSRAFVRLEMTRQKLATLRVGRRTLIPRQSFESYIGSRDNALGESRRRQQVEV